MQNSTVTFYFKAIIWDHWNICKAILFTVIKSILHNEELDFVSQSLSESKTQLTLKLQAETQASNEGADIVKYKNVDRWELEREKLIMKQPQHRGCI